MFCLVSLLLLHPSVSVYQLGLPEKIMSRGFKAAKSVTFDLLFLEIMFLIFKNTVI